MTFSKWLRRTFGSPVSAGRAGRRRLPRQPWRGRFLPVVELLEQRLAPATNTITVMGPIGTALGDSATITPLAPSGPNWTAVNLRSAVVGAEVQLTGSSQIVFDSTLFTTGPQTLNLTVAGNSSVGPSALQINKDKTNNPANCRRKFDAAESHARERYRRWRGSGRQGRQCWWYRPKSWRCWRRCRGARRGHFQPGCPHDP
jgi:hypothetical protein